MSESTGTPELVIEKADTGFYRGFNKHVTISSKIILSLLVIWSAVFPEEAGRVLNEIKQWSFTIFGAWYIYSMAFFLIVSLLVAIHPKSAKIKLGRDEDTPEFNRFSWVSMMFGAGIGIGMLTFSTAEPLSHFVNNPDTIRGFTAAESAGNTDSAFKWSFVHYGFTAWGCYCLAGMAMAYFSYRDGHPLTIRSALVPLFGNRLEGMLGHVVDIAAVIATILGISVTIGFGVSQFSAGIYQVTEASILVNESGEPSTTGMLGALIFVMAASTVSALSGVGRGIKWLSNINMVLSLALLAFFLIWGATTFSLTALAKVTAEYVVNLPYLLLVYWPDSDDKVGSLLFQWQSLGWTVFYWAWWVAFAPFVGLFLARISRGRSIREYVLGSLFVPSLVCFTWFTLVGGTAIDLELSGLANGTILAAGQESQLFATLKVMLSGTPLRLIVLMVVILLMTYLITSADSAVLVVNTINSGGDASQKGGSHIIVWGVSLTLVIAALLLAGGIDAVRASMFVGALPFSAVLVLMGISLVKAIFYEK